MAENKKSIFFASILFALVASSSLQATKLLDLNVLLQSKSVNVENEKESLNFLLDDRDGIPTKEMPGVFQIESFNEGRMRSSCGTGFFVERDGNKYLVSVNHNFENNKSVVLFRSKGPVVAKIGKHIRRKNEDIFVAIAETEEEALKLHPRLDWNEVTKDEIKGVESRKFDLNILGYPSSRGFRRVETKSTEGLIIFIDPKEKFLLANNSAGSGFSGGPWIENKSQSVIAVHSTVITKASGKKYSGGVFVNTIHDLIDILQEK
jgi:hypothetical protein